MTKLSHSCSFIGLPGSGKSTLLSRLMDLSPPKKIRLIFESRLKINHPSFFKTNKYSLPSKLKHYKLLKLTTADFISLCKNTSEYREIFRLACYTRPPNFASFEHAIYSLKYLTAYKEKKPLLTSLNCDFYISKDSNLLQYLWSIAQSGTKLIKLDLQKLVDSLTKYLPDIAICLDIPPETAAERVFRRPTNSSRLDQLSDKKALLSKLQFGRFFFNRLTKALRENKNIKTLCLSTLEDEDKNVSTILNFLQENKADQL